MFFLNLSLGEFFGLLASLSGVIAALYLLDRARKKKIVSTLRFWVEAPRVEEQRRRKRIREPWSLILQLLSLLLLLLAIGQLQWGSREQAGRNHVIVLDTSSWMAQRSGATNLLARAKERARRYIASLPARDRVMLIRADNLATPVTSLSENRKEVLEAIDASTASYSALNVLPALELASRAMKWSDAGVGEVVFAGGMRVGRWDDETASVPHLRVLPVEGDPENVGFRRLNVRRDPDDPQVWRALVVVRNYGKNAHAVTLRLRFAATSFAPRNFVVPSGQDRIEEVRFATTGPGTLAASLEPEDALAIDHHVQLELPSLRRLRVAVYTDRSAAWQPLFDADLGVQAYYLPVARYSPRPDADLMVVDGFSPGGPPEVPNVWVKPPPNRSPIPVLKTEDQALLNHWNSASELGVGLRSKEIRIPSAQIFDHNQSDITVVASDQGPIVVARPGNRGQPRLAVIVFDPLSGPLKYEVSTPLLFANLVRWLEPESLRTTDFAAAPVGTAAVDLDPNEAGGQLRVLDAAGFALPFTVRGNTLELYVSKPTIVRVISPGRERILSLTLPGIGEFEWKPPSNIPRTLPLPGWLEPSAVDLWRWLAFAGAASLCLEWLLFGAQRPWRWPKPAAARESSPSRERELVNQ